LTQVWRSFPLDITDFLALLVICRFAKLIAQSPVIENVLPAQSNVKLLLFFCKNKTFFPINGLIEDLLDLIRHDKDTVSTARIECLVAFIQARLIKTMFVFSIASFCQKSELESILLCINNI
jgi:hypothetical protein